MASPADDLELRTAYAADPARRRELIRFVRAIHGLDLAEWSERGLWDERYRPFSLFAGARIVANVCAYTMDMVIGGRRQPAVQLSAVGTEEGLRRRGLASRLTEAALAWAEPHAELVYLYADDAAVPFYRRRGFRPQAEHLVRLPVRGGEPLPGRRRLIPDDPSDLALVWRKARQRAAVSGRLGVLNPELLAFHALHALRGRMSYVEPLDVLVACRRERGVLTVYDVVGEVMPPWSGLYAYLRAPDDHAAELRFEPDRLAIAGGERVAVSQGLHVRGALPVSEPLIFPFTGQA